MYYEFAECLICQWTSITKEPKTLDNASIDLVCHSEREHKEVDGDTTGFRIHGVIHRRKNMPANANGHDRKPSTITAFGLLNKA